MEAIADALEKTHWCRILAAPMRLLQSVGDGFHLCFILQAAHQRLETLLARGRRFFAGRGSLTCGGHLQQLAEAAFIVLKNDVALDEIFRSEERRVGKECRSRWSPYH